MQQQVVQERMAFIDALRGLVIVLMALDHVRDFFGMAPFSPTDLAQTTPAWFATRYITHFCAPIFVFLAGCSAWLYGQTVTRPELSRFLLTRGAWLILLEASFISLSWGALFGGVMIFQVMWALGMAMVLLAGLIWLPRKVLALMALLLIAGHNLLDGIDGKNLGEWWGVWSFLHEPGFHAFGIEKTGLYLAYPLLPWLGVMLAGYLAAPYLQATGDVRQRRLWWCGGALLLLMVVLRSANLYGDPQPWSSQARGVLYSVMSFIHFQKYPPSLLYLCMTLGLGAWAMALLARIAPERLRWLLVFGRVPMFFYLIHLPLIHIGSHIWAILRYEQLAGWNYKNIPAPKDYEPSLLFVYAVWAAYMVALYFACRWYGEIKRRHPGGWLRYL